MSRMMAPLLALALVCSGTAHAAATAAPETRQLYLVLIKQARSDGKTRAALAYLDDFDKRFPAERDATILRVNCLLDLGQVAAAESVLARLAADGSGAASEIRGHVLSAQHHWADAARQYAAALSADPANWATSNALGYAQLRLGQPARAVETLKAARELAPGDVVVRNNLALALTVAGRRDEAARLLSAVADGAERARLRARLTEEAALLAPSPAPAAAH